LTFTAGGSQGPPAFFSENCRLVVKWFGPPLAVA
jgi:hypothetical protein